MPDSVHSHHDLVFLPLLEAPGLFCLCQIRHHPGKLACPCIDRKLRPVVFADYPFWGFDNLQGCFIEQLERFYRFNSWKDSIDPVQLIIDYKNAKIPQIQQLERFY